MTEPQWSIAQFLKPFPGFEQVYQGQPGSKPIAFPGVLDSYAKKKLPGYDPNLLAGLTCPLGARVRLWIPLALSGAGLNSVYQYQVIWRMRTIVDFVTGQEMGQVSPAQAYSGYHIGIGPYGQPEVLLDPATKRYFLPGSMETAVYPQAQPTSPNAGTPGVVQLQGQLLQPSTSALWTAPLTPSGVDASWQQGVYPINNSIVSAPSFVMYEFEAKGDEMSILATRIDGSDEVVWDFTSDEDDGAFSSTYGNSSGQAAVSPYSAIMVMFGT